MLSHQVQQYDQRFIPAAALPSFLRIHTDLATNHLPADASGHLSTDTAAPSKQTPNAGSIRKKQGDTERHLDQQRKHPRKEAPPSRATIRKERAAAAYQFSPRVLYASIAVFVLFVLSSLYWITTIAWPSN